MNTANKNKKYYPSWLSDNLALKSSLFRPLSATRFPFFCVFSLVITIFSNLSRINRQKSGLDTLRETKVAYRLGVSDIYLEENKVCGLFDCRVQPTKVEEEERRCYFAISTTYSSFGQYVSSVSQTTIVKLHAICLV